MQPLTHRVWEQHYTELRQAVVDRFPLVERWDIDRVNDDFDALVETLQRATGMDADRVLDELRALDVQEELGVDAEPEEEEPPEGEPGSVARLALGQGFGETERDRIMDRMQKLDRQLRRFPAQHVWLELTVKERDTPAQVVTLSAELPGLGKLVTSSKGNQDMAAALADVRDDMVDRIRDGIEKRTRGAR
jgi:ribosome-associated translation inhibitor RaiA